MTLFKKILQLSAITIIISTLICCGKYFVKPTQDIVPVHFKSATELTSAIRSGEITSLDLLNLYLNRIQRYNNEINAVVALDIAAARARATEADRALAQGKIWGPLHGLPMTVKDVFEVAGMPATSGDPVLKDYIPKRNAIAVQRLIDAGAIVFGKTNVPYHAMDIQSYNEIYGTTNNPWDLSRTPGGSSGGSAAALAVGFTALELGSDIAGSVRFPPHYTGVFGHKTTFGIVPRYGHIPPMPGRVPPKAVEKLRGAGLDINEEAHPDIELLKDRQIWLEIYNQMMAGSLPLDEMLVERQKKQQARWAEFFESYDVLLAPVAPTVAFPHDHEGTLLSRSLEINGQKKPMLNNMAWTYMAIVSGLPATVAPVGLSDSGLPVGIQIIGARFEDRTTIDFARGLSETIGGFVAPPGYED